MRKRSFKTYTYDKVESMKKEQELNEEEALFLKKATDFYGSLDKLVRGINLYQGKGPLVKRLLDDCFRRVEELTKKNDLTVKVSPVGPMLSGRPLADEGKLPKYIFQMYRDGIRELSFHKGLGPEELGVFAEICSADFGAIEDDMVTLLWKGEFSSIRYYAVDSLGVEVDEELPDDLLSSADSNLRSLQEGEEMQLSSSDMRLLKTKDNLNWVRSCTAPFIMPAELKPTLEKLEKYWKPKDPYSSFLAIALKASETGAIEVVLIEQIFASILVTGETKSVLDLLNSMTTIAKQGLSSVIALLQCICSEENLRLMLPLFDGHTDEFVSVFREVVSLDNFDASSFVTLLNELAVGQSRVAIQEIVSASSVDLTPLYLNGLSNEDEAIVLDSIEALGALASETAIEALYLQLGNSLSSIRIAILEAIGGVYIPEHRKQLGKTLKDPEKENRLLALSILEQATERDVGVMILGVIKEATFSRREDEEKTIFFKSLSNFPSPTVFGFLNDILQQKNITRKKELVKQQLLVVEVYQKMKIEDALSMLEVASHNWFLPNDVKLKIKEVLR